MEVIALIIVGIGVYALLSGKASAGEVGLFWLGILAKVFYSAIAIGLCLAIPIPVVNIIIAVIVVLQIWGSPVRL